MYAMPFQKRLQRQEPGKPSLFRGVRVGPYMISIQAGGHAYSAPRGPYLPAEAYTRFELSVPESVAPMAERFLNVGYGEETGGEESVLFGGSAERRRIFPYVEAGAVQAFLDWLVRQGENEPDPKTPYRG